MSPELVIASSGNDYGTGANATYYNAKLVSIGGSTTGNATAKVDVADGGGITTKFKSWMVVVHMVLVTQCTLLVLQPQETPHTQQLSQLHQSMTTEVTSLESLVLLQRTNQPYNVQFID